MKILKRINKRVAAEETRMILRRLVAMAPHTPEPEVAGSHKQSVEVVVMLMVGSHKEAVAAAEIAMVVAENCNELVVVESYSGPVVAENCSEPVAVAKVMVVVVESGTLEEVEAMVMAAASKL